MSQSRVPLLGQPFPSKGRFRVLRSLGEGGMGVVYEVHDDQRGGKVALKTMLRVSPEGIARFKREFRALADLHHPNLVDLYELGCEGSQWFFTMELIEGGDFLEYVRPTALDEGRLRAVLPQLVSGLTALHAAGMVHRDVKPSNVRVTPAGRLVLLDFGLVAELAAPLGGSAVSFVGTPAYMAPEQADATAVGPAADWYAVGALLYEALTGKVPFEGPPLQVLIRKQRERPTHPTEIEPSVPEDLARLCMDLMSPQAAERPTGAAVSARLARRSMRPPQSSSTLANAPFVGRLAELTQLREAFEHAVGGKAVLTLVQGVSGVGKSSLVKHFTDELARERADLLVVAGRCYERESVPYKAFDGVVDALAHRLARLPDAGASALIPDHLAALCQVFPVLRRVRVFAAMTRPVSIAPQELRRRAFGALRQLLVRLTAQSALVIVVDDLQWTDADSMSLLREVLRQPEAPPLLFIATVRVAAGSGSGSLGALSPSHLEAELPGAIRHIEVGRLGPREARELAEQLLRDLAPERAASATSIAEETGGHPMFIDALARHTASEPAAQGTTSALKLDDALWSRVTHLDPAARELVEAVAVAGAPMSQEAMASAAGMDMAEFGRVVGGLRAANLVRTAGARGADAIEAYHDRVREAVTARVDAEARERLHGRLAIALEAAAAPDVEALARHWAGAGDTARALRNAKLAAEQAATALAFARSAQWWQRTLELSPGDGPDRRALRMQLADALANAGRGARAAEEYEAAARGGSGGEALELRRRAADQLLRSGHFDRGLAMAREALAAVSLTLPASPLGALVRLLFWRFVLLLRGTSFRERDPSEVAPRVLTRIDVAWSLAIGLAMTDNVYGALFNTRTLLLALRAGEPFRVSRSLSAETTFRATPGKPAWARVKRIAQAARTLAERTGNQQARAWARGTEGAAHYLNGRFRTALAFCDEATLLYRQSGGTPSEMVSAQLLAINSLAYLGELQELQKRVRECIEDAVDRGDLYAEVSFTIGFPNLAWLVDDDPATARARTAAAMKKWSKQGFHLEHFYELVAETHVDLYAGEFAAAHERLLQREGALRRLLLMRIQSVRTLLWFLQARAAIGVACVDGSRRREMLEQATAWVRRIAREDTEWGEPVVAWLEAGIAAARGDAGVAQVRTRDAIAGFDATDMRLLSLVAELGAAMLSKDEDRTTSAAQKLRERGIANPTGFVRVFAPSFVPSARS